MEKIDRKKIRERSENAIPDYEFLFKDEKGKSKKNSAFLTQIIKQNFWKLVFSSILNIIKASPLWAMPIITANIINIASVPFNENSWRNITINGLILTVMLLQNVPMHSWYAKITDNMLRDISAGIKSTLIRKLQQLSITYHKEMETGKIQSKFLKDTESIDALLSNIIRSVIPNIIFVGISITIAMLKSGVISLFFLVVIPFNVILTLFFRKILKKRNRNYRIESENVSAQLSNMLEMLSVTKAHGLEQDEIIAFEKSIKNLKGSGLLVDRANAYFGAWNWVINNILNSGCLIFCAVLAIKEKIMVGDIVLYQSLFVSIVNYVLGLVGILPALTSGMEAVYSLSEIMLSNDVEKNAGKIKIEALEGVVQFKNVSYKYSDSKQYVIKKFNLDVKPGECIAIVGPSGSGKSTIMNLIIGFLKPVSGELIIDGKSIENLDLSEYRKHISVVSQNCILFAGTIRENITYGLKDYSEEDLTMAVEKANLSDLIKEMPNGMDSQIGEHGGKLSGGQKQRITIARALIRNPKILILDEATSALDNISEYHVQQAISKSIKGRTTFIVAHRLSTIRDADRIVVMDEGICVEAGTYQELIDKKGKFYELKILNDMNMKEANTALN